MALSDNIESYILNLLTDEVDTVDLRRNELALHFCCAPSQINYVLQTRFSVERGYLIESRRGGGGYVRVLRVKREALPIRDVMLSLPDGGLSQAEAFLLLEWLYQQNAIESDTARLLKAAVSDAALESFPNKGRIRAEILRRVLSELL